MAEEADAEDVQYAKKCFRTPTELFYGSVKRDPENENGWIRHGLGSLLETKGDEKDGRGRVIISTYEGWFEDNEITGNGIYTFQDGSVYSGLLVKGVPHGAGRMVWPDGASYEGNWDNGMLHGQGRFVAEQGDFREGEFQYNRFCFRGTWVDIVKDVVRVRETEALLQSDHTIIPVQYCLPDRNHLMEVVDNALQRDNVIPFILPDSEALSDASLLLGDNTYHMGQVVVRRRRNQDYKKPLKDGISRSITEGKLFSLVLPAQEGDIPNLDNYFDPFSFPLEIFNPKAFRGRPELQRQFVDEEFYGDLCPFALVGGALQNEVTPDRDLVHEEVLHRYGAFVPLHRCVIIVLTTMN